MSSVTGKCVKSRPAWLLELLLLCGKTYASATIVYAKRKKETFR